MWICIVLIHVFIYRSNYDWFPTDLFYLIEFHLLPNASDVYRFNPLALAQISRGRTITMAQIEFRPLNIYHYNDTLHYTQSFIWNVLRPYNKWKLYYISSLRTTAANINATVYFKEARAYGYIRHWHQFQNSQITKMADLTRYNISHRFLAKYCE